MYKRKHEQSLQPASSCNEVIVQPVRLKETSPSLKPQDAHGVGLAFIPINPNSSAKPKPRDGSPVSHLLVEDFIEDEDKSPSVIKPSKTRNLEVNIKNNRRYINNQDETIKEEKQDQHRISLSDFKNISRRSGDNPRKEDQDQEEEPIDLGIDWNRRFPRYESRSSLRNYKTRDSRSENSITLDIDENWQSEFWARAMEEKEKRHQELQTIEQQWEVIEQERRENVQMTEWVEEQKII